MVVVYFYHFFKQMHLLFLFKRKPLLESFMWYQAYGTLSAFRAGALAAPLGCTGGFDRLQEGVSTS